jgi:hypothetical protein
MSPKKHAAQIANAHLSQGPRTAEGKANSSRNPLRHGFCSAKYKVLAHDRDEFERHCAEMLEALAPEGAVEMLLAEAIAVDQFRLFRIKNVENEIFAQGFVGAKEEFFAGAETWNARCKELALITLYEQRINRTLTRNKQELEAKQAARKVAQASRPAHPEVTEATESTGQTSSPIPALGIVHSSAPETHLPAEPSAIPTAPAIHADLPNPAPEVAIAA